MHVINRCTEYALLALHRMAGAASVVSAQELAEKLDIPHPFLRTILRTLKEHRLIRSQRGKKGGFILEKPADSVSLFEVMAIFQGPLRLIECSGPTACSRAPACTLKEELEFVERDLVRNFRSITLRSLLDKHHKNSEQEKEKIC